jgi:hypothetical protein
LSEQLYMLVTLNWITPIGFLYSATELVPVSLNISAEDPASNDAITYRIISGKLPIGLSLSLDGNITGSAESVIDTTYYKFVVRARNLSGLVDRTFQLSVAGPSEPVWLTPEGYLIAGLNQKKYVLNYQWIDFQLSAKISTKTPAAINLKYYIEPNSGMLPPGLSLDVSGRISGKVNIINFSSVDHAISYETPNTFNIVPKLYNFSVNVSDGVATQTRKFKILVVSPGTLSSYTSPLSINNSDLNLDFLPAYVSELQPVQWIISNDLGIIRANNNQDINILAYDPVPRVGPVSYSLISNQSAETNLPSGLKLDSSIGVIYGFIPYQPAYSRSYQLTIVATKTNSKTAETTTTTNVFSLTVKGEVESNLVWASNSNLGNITTGIISDLSIVAEQLYSSSTIKYQLISGILPNGLILNRDGTLSGKINYNAIGVYSFIVRASGEYEMDSIERTFTINAVSMDDKKYTEIYAAPFFSLEKRALYKDFMSDESIFDPKLIYRYFDINFGVRHNIKLVLEFGIEKINLSDYSVALQENFYHKTFHFGDIKVALAKDSANKVIYEIVYVDVVDTLINNQGVSIGMSVLLNNQTYYPNSITNMKTRLQSVVLDNGATISTNVFNQPIFMQPEQAGNYVPNGYIRIIPLCYVIPGQSNKIMNKINASKFDFKQLNFEIDRLVVQSTEDHSSAKYLIFDKSLPSIN